LSFTLVELLVTVAIIPVLASFAVAVVGPGEGECAGDEVCFEGTAAWDWVDAVCGRS
jgi:prepilin-type N-terminal cleavage/methylation domain-containing protein